MLQFPSRPRDSTTETKHNCRDLAHYYEEGDIQDVADFVGDSLGDGSIRKRLKGRGLCWSPALFLWARPRRFSLLKRPFWFPISKPAALWWITRHFEGIWLGGKHPDALCVTYVNSSAEVKSITDVACTSSNAEKILEAIPKDRQVLFGPDRNLGRYLAKKTGKRFDSLAWSLRSSCPLLGSKLYELKRETRSLVLAHPECLEEVLEYADVIGSTSKLLNEVKTNPKNEFIVATEEASFTK